MSSKNWDVEKVFKNPDLLTCQKQKKGFINRNRRVAAPAPNNKSRPASPKLSLGEEDGFNCCSSTCNTHLTSTVAFATEQSPPPFRICRNPSLPLFPVPTNILLQTEHATVEDSEDDDEEKEENKSESDSFDSSITDIITTGTGTRPSPRSQDGRIKQQQQQKIMGQYYSQIMGARSIVGLLVPPAADSDNNR